MPQIDEPFDRSPFVTIDREGIACLIFSHNKDSQSRLEVQLSPDAVESLKNTLVKLLS